MKIAIVCPYDLTHRGGVQQQAIGLMDRLSAGPDEAWLVGPGSGDGWTSLGPSVTLRGNRSRVPVALAPSVGRRLRRAVAGADLIHLHEPMMPLVGWAGNRLTAPIVATFHAAAPWWGRALYRIAPRPPGLLTAVSRVAAAAIPGRWGPVEIIPNGLEVAAFAGPIDRVPGRVIFVGRDDPRKGLGVLVAAWPEVLARHPEAELVAVGPSRPPGVDRARFLGPVGDDEKRALLASSPVFVAPNLGGESFGVTVAEGMAAGCGVVASGLPGFRSVLADAGRYVPAGDPAALALAIGELLDHPDRSARLGEAARMAVERFDWSRVIEQYRAAYMRAIET